MSNLKGYASKSKEERVSMEFVTVEPIRLKQDGLSVNAHIFVYEVGTDAVEAASTVSSIVATAHSAQRGDVIRFTSGALNNLEVKVGSVTTNAIIPAEDLPSAPAAAVTFQILRPKYPIVNEDGSLNVAFSEQATGADGAVNPVLVKVVAGTDGTNIQTLKTDAQGELQIDVLSSALPTGASTSAKQDTGNTSLASIDTHSAAIDTATAAINTKVSTETTLAAASAKLPATLGQKAMSASMAVALASDQSSIPVTQSGTWNITNVSGTVSLPTGAATETTLSAASAKLPATLGQKAMSASMAVVLASDQTAIPVSQSGTWNVTNVSGTVSLPTGASTETTLAAASAKLPATLGQKTMANSMAVVLASDQSAVTVAVPGKSAVDKCRKDYSAGSVTTGAYVQLIASLAGACTEVEIFDSSGQTLFLATGGAGSETDKVYILPGGNGRIPLAIAASTRVAVKAVSATASLGELTINFYG